MFVFVDPFHIQSLKKSGVHGTKSKSCEDGECCSEGRGINGKGEGKGSKVKVENRTVVNKGKEDMKVSMEKNEPPAVNTPNGLDVVDLCEEVDLGLGEEDHVPGVGNGVDLPANEAEDIRPVDGAPCPPPHYPLDKAKVEKNFILNFNFIKKPLTIKQKDQLLKCYFRC